MSIDKDGANQKLEAKKLEHPIEPSGERRHGLLTVNTSHGFVEHENAMFGEHQKLKKLGLAFKGLGDGFTWRSKDLDKTEALAAIKSGDWDMIVLDEFTYALTYGWVDWVEVKAVLEARDPRLHVVITGRDALPELIEIADTVTEMRPVKHAYDSGVQAQAGIEH